MDTRWKKWKPAVSLLAFFLGVNLLVGGTAGFLFVRFTAAGPSVGDAFAADYQDTAGFRRAMSDSMLELFELAGEAGAQGVLPEGYDAALRGDENILYVVRLKAEGGVLRDYANSSSSLTAGERDELPEGYNFWMRYQNGTVTAWKDGAQVDLYGDGTYRGGGQWRLPGYRNYSVDLPPEGTVITLAAAAQPSAAREGGGGLYYLVEDLRLFRTVYTVLLTALGAGAALLVWSIAWRRYKKAAVQAAAAFTGRILLEVKLLGLPLLFLCGLLAASGVMWLAAGAAWLCLWLLYLYFLDLRCNGKAVFTNSLWHRYHNRCSRSLAGWSGRIWLEVKLAVLLPVALFCWRAALFLWDVVAYGVGSGPAEWAAVLLAAFCAWLYVNDLRKNGAAVFENSLCFRLADILRAKELNYPVQKRMERAAVGGALTTLFFALCWALLCVLAYPRFGYYGSARAGILLLLCAGLAALCLAWRILRRARANAADLGVLLDQIAAVHSGGLDRGFTLPEDADLRAASEQLTHIQQGMRTALAEQLKSERIKVELISNVSHDLKTPLTSILSYAELLREEEGLPGHVRDYIRILDEKAQRLRTMVQEVFEVSKAASGALSVRAERLDFKKLLEQTLADMADPIEKSGLTFRTELPPAPVFITGDGDRLYRVFQNLLQNVLQYALEGSRVFIRLDEGEREAVATVKNISRTELPAGVDFTERFLRGDESRTDGGSGLGLAIASSFVQACGGTFRVETDADLFTARVSFPKRAADADAPD